MSYEIDYEDGCDYRRIKEEPDCYTCSDRGTILVDAWGKVHDASQADEVWLFDENCPDCNPNPKQIAAREAAHAELVASGQANFDTDPPF